MSSRRPLTIVAALVVMLLLTAGTASAADDLAEYLERADGAVYSGTKVVYTIWGGETEFAVLDVQHALGMTMYSRAGEDVMAGGGKLRALATEGGALQVIDWERADASHRYRVEALDTGSHAGRSVDVVGVYEGDLLRARLSFDRETHAPMSTEVFSATGDLFRYGSMLQFTAKADLPPPSSGDPTPYEVVARAGSFGLPETAAGYRLVDRYLGPDDGSLQAFYSDGLFRFSVFAIEGRSAIDELVEGTTMRLAGSDYTVSVTATDTWILWNGPATTYVLVGDLPPDHAEAVLDELPEPSEWNFLQRLWHRLFG